MPNFQIHRPTTSIEAVKLYSEKTTAKFVAGGTDIIVNVRRGIEQPENLIDLGSITELKEIRENPDRGMFCLDWNDDDPI